MFQRTPTIDYTKRTIKKELVAFKNQFDKQ